MQDAPCNSISNIKPIDADLPSALPQTSVRWVQREWRRQLERAEEMARASIAAEQKIIAEKEAQLRAMTEQNRDQQVRSSQTSAQARTLLRPSAAGIAQIV